MITPPRTQDARELERYNLKVCDLLNYLTDYLDNSRPWYKHTGDVTDVYAYKGGPKLATFTLGSRTVCLYRTPRTFTELKQPFTDEFQRIRSGGWGPSPGGGNWGVYGGVAENYSVNGAGYIHAAPVNTSHYARVNNIVKEFDAQLAFSINSAPAGNSNSVSLVGGWLDTGDHMRFRLTVTEFGNVIASIAQRVNASETILATAAGYVGANYQANQVYHIRGTFDGVQTYRMYAWKDGAAVPTLPTVTYTYPTLEEVVHPTGKLGVRCFTSTGATNDPIYKITEFSVTKDTKWPVAPTVTHNVWVRVLAQPFNGLVDLAWLVAELANDTPDLLDAAMKYVNGNVSPAHYGPMYNIGRTFDLLHATDGTRQEGGDWNDFDGIDGKVRYTHLKPPKTDPPEPHQILSLDCSGYVRRVFGVDYNFPMCISDPEDFNGINIPRRSVEQHAHGPGNLLIPHTGSKAPADYSMILPGDILFFDADSSDPDEEEGQIDHEGIYLGIDDNDGKARFISSRKTADGPTFCDLGGNSAINGTGLYARSFRAARRY